MTLLTLVAVAFVLGRPSNVPADTQLTAVVTARSAEFSIPVAHDGLWRWYRATTSDDALEYQWEIAVSSRGVEYELGFSLYKFPGLPEGVGDLAKLLSAGQGSLWIRHPDDGASLVPGVTISVAARDGGVVIRVPDAATVRMLFADRPATVRVLSRTPDTENESKEVSIAYRE